MVTPVEYSTINQSEFLPVAFESATLGENQIQNAAVAASVSVPASARNTVSLRSIASELNSRASTPLHDQLFSLLKKAFDEGHLEDVCDGRLPSMRTMSVVLGVSRETVAKAISKLSGYGYLSAEERKRIYVRPKNINLSADTLDRSRPSSAVEFDENDQGSATENSERPLDFRPPLDDSIPSGGFGRNYLTDKYLKTLRKQSVKRARIDMDPCGMLSFREVLCEQLKRDSNINCRAENLIVFPDFKACADFIVRLTTRGRSTCVVEAPGPQELHSILDLNAQSIVEIPVDEEGMRVDILSSYGVTDSVCFVSPSMHDPLGVRLSSERMEKLIAWAKESNSIVVEHSASQGLLRTTNSQSLWNLASDQGFVYAWTLTSALKPLAQTCCAVFSDDLIKEARRLKSTVGGEVSIGEQMALQDFILDGDLLRTQRQRELLNLEKRRRLGLALARVFKGCISVWRGNCGPRMVFELKGDANAVLVSETSRICGLPLKLLNEPNDIDQNVHQQRLVLDLDLINIDSISNKIESLEQMLGARESAHQF